MKPLISENARAREGFEWQLCSDQFVFPSKPKKIAPALRVLTKFGIEKRAWMKRHHPWIGLLGAAMFVGLCRVVRLLPMRDGQPSAASPRLY